MVVFFLLFTREEMLFDLSPVIRRFWAPFYPGIKIGEASCLCRGSRVYT